MPENRSLADVPPSAVGPELDRLRAENQRLREELTRLQAECRTFFDRHSEFESILDNDLVGIAFVKQRKYVWVSRKFAAIHGYRPEEMQGRGTELVHLTPENYRQEGAKVYSHLTKESVYEGEVQVRRRDGSLFWALVCGRALNPDDVQQGSIWVVRDFTERRRIEEALRKSEEFQRRIIESSQDCIKVLDLEGFLLSMSAAGQRLMELDSLAPLLNKSWIDLWSGEGRDAARCAADIVRLPPGDMPR